MANFTSERSKVTPLIKHNIHPNPRLPLACKIDLFFCRGPIYDTLENQLPVKSMQGHTKTLQSQCEQVEILLFGERLGRTYRRPTNQIIRP